MSKISDILDKTLSVNIRGDYPNGYHELILKGKEQAEQQLKQYFKEEWLKLVGEDEPVPSVEEYVEFRGGSLNIDDDDNPEIAVNAENDLRAKLRKAIDKWEG